jgi:CheY-like chemotaxis protein/HPt (histidine-containing phosphotransfer) domain-containing protein
MSGQEIIVDKQNSRILVVDDNNTNLDVAATIVRKLGYVTDVARNGQEAIAAISVKAYDIVLMDCRMPVLDGYEATAAIRTMNSTCNPNVPIIAMTASAMPGDREKCLVAGMDDYITKPVNSQHLAAILSRWLHQAAHPNELPEITHTTKSDTDTTLTGEYVVMDSSVLLRLLDDDKEMAVIFLARFYQDTLQRNSILIEAVGNNQLDIIRFQAHTMSGAAVTVGALALANITKKVETASERGDLDLVKDLMPEMTRCIEQFASLVC